MPAKAVFLDRDHTLIEDPGYIADPKLVKLLPGAASACRSLAAAGYKLVIVTNQSGIARGLLTEDTLGKIHDELRCQFARNDVQIDAIYYCPFHPEGVVEGYIQESELRKPKPGMLLQAAAEMDIDLSQSWMVGDSTRDVEAGRGAGCRTVLIRNKAHEAQNEGSRADYVVGDIAEAARVILGGQPQPPRAPHKPAPQKIAPSPAAAPASQAPGDNPDVKAMVEQAVLPPVHIVPQKANEREARFQSEVLEHLRRLAQPAATTFSLSKLLAGGLFSLSAVLLAIGAVRSAFAGSHEGTTWLLAGIGTSVLSLTLFTIRRD